MGTVEENIPDRLADIPVKHNYSMKDSGMHIDNEAENGVGTTTHCTSELSNTVNTDSSSRGIPEKSSNSHVALDSNKPENNVTLPEGEKNLASLSMCIKQAVGDLPDVVSLTDKSIDRNPVTGINEVTSIVEDSNTPLPHEQHVTAVSKGRLPSTHNMKDLAEVKLVARDNEPSEPRSDGGDEPSEPRGYGDNEPSEPRSDGGDEPSEPRGYGDNEPSKPRSDGGDENKKVCRANNLIEPEAKSEDVCTNVECEIESLPDDIAHAPDCLPEQSNSEHVEDQRSSDAILQVPAPEGDIMQSSTSGASHGTPHTAEMVAVVKLVRCAATDEQVANALKDAEDVENLQVSCKFGSFFTCSEFTGRFTGINQLIQHGLAAHNVKLCGDRIFELIAGCPNCGKKYQHVDSQRKHARLCNPKAKKVCQLSTTEQKCRFCSFVASTRKTIRVHEMRYHSQPVQRHCKSQRKTSTLNCPICKRKFNRYSQLLNHKKIVHTKNKVVMPNSSLTGQQIKAKCQKSNYLCHLCGTVMLKGSTSKHLRTVHHTTMSVVPLAQASLKQSKQTNPVCIYCNSTFITHAVLYNHIKSVHKEMCVKMGARVIKCPSCSLVFQNKKQLDHHADSCSNIDSKCKMQAKQCLVEDDLVFPCPKCSKVLATFKTLKYHMRDMHNVKDAASVVIEGIPRVSAKKSTPECKQCDMSFTSWSKLYSHLRKSRCKQPKELQSAVNYVCTVCSLSFQSQHRLDCHSSLHHKSPQSSSVVESPARSNRRISVKSEPRVRSPSRKPITCSLCDKKSDTGDAWYRHLRTFHRLTERKCRAMLEQVQLEQTAEIVVKSETIETESLQSHPRKVAEPLSCAMSSSDIYSCELCDMSYYTSKSLDRHYRERHPTKRKETTNRNRKDDERLLLCHVCDLSTKYASNLTRHYRRAHGYSAIESKRYVDALKNVDDTSHRESGNRIETSKPTAKMEDVNSMASNTPFTVEYSSSDSSSSASSGSIPTYISSSSSDDSSSDESEARKPPMAVANKRRISSSSSSSSDGSSSEAIEEIKPVAFPVKSKPIDTQNQLDEDSSVPHSSVNATIPSEKVNWSQSLSLEDQFLPKEVLTLDEEIFCVKRESTAVHQETKIPDKHSAVRANVVDVRNSDMMSSLDDKPAHNVVDASLNPNNAVESLADDSRHCESKKSIQYVAAKSNGKAITVSKPLVASVDTSKKLATADVHVERSISSVEKLKSKAKNFAEAKSSDCGKNASSHKTVPPAVSALKRTPVAVLRPFSVVPEWDSALTTCGDGHSDLGNEITKAVILENPSQTCQKNPINSTGIRMEPLTISSSTPSIISYPVYLVNSTDVILPCMDKKTNTQAYIRICCEQAKTYQRFFTHKWYEDFSYYTWTVIALLSEPLEIVEEVKRLLNWILKSEITSVSSKSTPTRLPRINNNNPNIDDYISYVTSYNTATYSAICCLCGMVVQDTDQFTSHVVQGHIPCGDCHRLQSPINSHTCSRLRPANSRNASVMFVNLASPGSETCSPIAVSVASAKTWAENKTGMVHQLNTQLRMLLRDMSFEYVLKKDYLAMRNFHQKSNAPLARVDTANHRTGVLDRSYANSSMQKISAGGSFKSNSSGIVDSNRLAENGNGTALKIRSSEASENILTKSKTVSAFHLDLLEKSSHPYYCSLCDIKFLLKVQLDHHQQTLHKRCTLCAKLFKTRQDRSDHISKAHRSFICLACDHTCTSDQAIKGHIMRNHVDMETGLFNCTKCPNKQVHPEAIVEHLKDDDLDSNRKCHLCECTLPLEENAKLEHFFSHSLSESNAFCLACSRLYLEDWALRSHMLYAGHSSCGMCLFTDYKSMVDHRCPFSISSTGRHPLVKQEARKEILRVSQFSRYCTTCCAVVEETTLRQHYNAHHSQYQLQCDICGQRFEFEHQRAFHMGVHKKRTWRYFLCTNCLSVTSAQGPKNPNQQMYNVNYSCRNCDTAPQVKMKASDASTSNSRKSEAAMEVEIIEIDTSEVGTNNGLKCEAAMELEMNAADGNANSGSKSEAAMEVEMDTANVSTSKSKDTTMEVTVSVEDVQSCELDSGDVQLMLDGKLYNFIPAEDTEILPKQCSSSMTTALSSNDEAASGPSYNTATNDDDSDALVIDDSETASPVGDIFNT